MLHTMGRYARLAASRQHLRFVKSSLHLDIRCRGAAKIARPRAGYFAQLSNSSLCTKGANRLVRVEVRSRNALARRVGTIRVEHRPAGQRDPCNDQTGGKPRNRVPELKAEETTGNEPSAAAVAASLRVEPISVMTEPLTCLRPTRWSSFRAREISRDAARHAASMSRTASWRSCGVCADSIGVRR